MKRTLTVATLLIWLVTGCTSNQTQPAPREPVTQGPVATNPGGGPPPELESFALEWRNLVRQADPGTVKHLHVQSGQPIDNAGIFFMKVTSGEIDGWAGPAVQYAVSDDNRWVSMTDQKNAYLIDRKAEAVFQWEFAQGRLIAAQGDFWLFASTERLWLVREGGQRATVLPLTPADPQAAFSADGKSLILLNDRKVYLLRPETGDLQHVGELTTTRPKSEWGRVSIAPARRGAEAMISAEYYGAEGGSAVQFQRYSWQGERLADLTAPFRVQFSPDGKLATWTEWLPGLTSTVVVAGAEDFKPLLRVMGADFCTEEGIAGDRWLSDGTGLVIRTESGDQLLRTDGTLRTLKALEGTSSSRETMPAPDRADLFAIGRTMVVDATGKRLSTAVPHSEGNWFGTGSLAPWGTRSDEMRFVLKTGGHGPRCSTPLLAPQVERAPLAVSPGLVVNLPANDCLNLRRSFGSNAPVITCLPNGSRLMPATPLGRLNKGSLEGPANPLGLDMGGSFWWYARTETGQRGWVSFSSEYLAWAPNAAPSDPLLDRLTDEVANLQFWLGAALGETACGVACGEDSSFENIVGGLIGRCAGGVWPGELIKTKSYDAKRHGSMAGAIENACEIIRSAHGTLGDPRETPQWRQKILDARNASTK